LKEAHLRTQARRIEINPCQAILSSISRHSAFHSDPAFLAKFSEFNSSKISCSEKRGSSSCFSKRLILTPYKFNRLSILKWCENILKRNQYFWIVNDIHLVILYETLEYCLTFPFHLKIKLLDFVIYLFISFHLFPQQVVALGYFILDH
jgi:hypothetical protein